MSNSGALGYVGGICLLAAGCAFVVDDVTTFAVSGRAIEFASRKPAQSRVEIGLVRQARIENHAGSWHEPAHVVWAKPDLTAAQLAIALDAAEDVAVDPPLKAAKFATASKCAHRQCSKSRRVALRGAGKTNARADAIAQNRKTDPFIQFEPHFAGTTAEITERGLRVRG